jgi:glycosyltransferase involved in cell wall biosynthesis
LKDLRNLFFDRILHDGFADTVDEYWSWLRRLDVVVSTAEHEFFGIAVCEAIWAGAVAVLPNRLSYPELVPRECLYESLGDAVVMIEKLQDAEKRNRLSDACRKILEPLRMEQTVPRLDDALQRLGAEVRQ